MTIINLHKPYSSTDKNGTPITFKNGIEYAKVLT
jgi:hypothetical protein